MVARDRFYTTQDFNSKNSKVPSNPRLVGHPMRSEGLWPPQLATEGGFSGRISISLTDVAH